MSAKHTPGPWKIVYPNAPYIHITDLEETKTIAALGSTSLGQANATLIAAAPVTADERDRLKAVNAELLEVVEIGITGETCLFCGRGNLQELVCTSDDCPGVAAIAKAKGE